MLVGCIWWRHIHGLKAKYPHPCPFRSCRHAALALAQTVPTARGAPGPRWRQCRAAVRLPPSFILPYSPIPRPDRCSGSCITQHRRDAQPAPPPPRPAPPGAPPPHTFSPPPPQPIPPPRRDAEPPRPHAGHGHRVARQRETLAGLGLELVALRKLRQGGQL